MDHRLPPLNALRAFETAARHGSFARAAAELNVTPAAVSHQVKALEDHLGVSLFKRLTRGLVLTDSGRAVLPELTKGFGQLARAAGQIRTGTLAGPLRITALPSFARQWLVPKLGTFFERYPEIDLSLFADYHAVDFATEDMDLGIRYGLGRHPGLWSRLLLTEEVFPVCAPTLLNGPKPLRRLQDLRHHRLLHDCQLSSGEPWLSWSQWLREAGVEGVDATRGPGYSDSDMLVEATVRGQGVSLGRTALIADHLASGHLVRPFPISRPADFAYYLVMPPANAEQPRAQAFVQWVETQVAAGRAGTNSG